MEEQERRLKEFRQEQEELKKRQSDKHAEEKRLRDEQVKRQQVRRFTNACRNNDCACRGGNFNVFSSFVHLTSFPFL